MRSCWRICALICRPMPCWSRWWRTAKDQVAAKFRDYFAYQEAFKAVPPHRALALFRGRKEEMLKVSLKLPEDIAAAAAAGPASFNACEAKVAARFGLADRRQPADAWLLQTAHWTWQVKLSWQLESELLAELRERAEQEAIRVFARNLHDLLLAAPAGSARHHGSRSRIAHRREGRDRRSHRKNCWKRPRYIRMCRATTGMDLSRRSRCWRRSMRPI